MWCGFLVAAILLFAFVFFVWAERVADPERALPASLARRIHGIAGVLESHLDGVPVTDEVLDDCGAALDAYGAFLANMAGKEVLEDSPLPHRASFYFYALQVSALGHPRHDAWPIHPLLRSQVLPHYRRQLKREENVWLRFAAIMPAVLEGDIDFAVECFERLSERPELAKVALDWVRLSTKTTAERNRPANSEALLAALDVPASAPASRAE